MAISGIVVIDNDSVKMSRYHKIFEALQCGICIHDKTGKILEINGASESIFGTSRENIIGKSFDQFIKQEDRDYAKVQLKKLVAERIIGPNEGRILQPNGQVKDIEFSSCTIDINHEEVLLTTLYDTTQSNAKKNQAFLRDKLSSIGRFAAGVAQEINNPIAWITANFNVIKAQLEGSKESVKKLTEIYLETDQEKKVKAMESWVIDVTKRNSINKFEEMINDSLQGTDRIRGIVHDLKGFAYVSDDDVTPVDLHETINSAINIAISEYKLRATLIKKYSDEVRPILANTGKLHQVFLNLIVNAAQAIPVGSASHNVIRISSQIEGDRIRIDISDTGRGIPPEVLSRIFEPFFTTKPLGSGAGLGLSVCREIINSLGGEITVQSKLGKGTEFSIYFKQQSHVVVNQAPPDKVDILSYIIGKRVLVVSDEPLLSKAIKRLLENYHSVIMAQGGRNALEVLSQDASQFDVAIVDFNMSDVSGADLYRYLSKKYPGLESRIIFMVGDNYSAENRSFIENTANLCLEKPFNADDILKIIDAAMKMRIEEGRVNNNDYNQTSN